MRGTTIMAVLISAAIAAGVLLLRYAYVDGGIENNDPLHLPFPGAGLTANQSFRLANGGRFMLEVTTPATEAERDALHREQPPVSCDVALTISGPAGFRLAQRIVSLRNSGWTADANIYMPDEPIVLPRGGTYDVSLASRAPVDVFRERGAMVDLTRFQPVGPELGYPIAAALAYACFLLSLAGTVYLGTVASKGSSNR